MDADEADIDSAEKNLLLKWKVLTKGKLPGQYVDYYYIYDQMQMAGDTPTFEDWEEKRKLPCKPQTIEFPDHARVSINPKKPPTGIYRRRFRVTLRSCPGKDFEHLKCAIEKCELEFVMVLEFKKGKLLKPGAKSQTGFRQMKKECR